MTRRYLLALLVAARASAQKPAKLKRPIVCVSSQALSGVGYAEMGEIVKQIGFDGVDITVMPGGLVEPQQAPVDEVRALESIHGAGLEAPTITTALTTPYDPWSRTVLALAGRTGVGLFKCGPRLRTKRDSTALALEGREYKIGLCVPVGSRSGALDLAAGRELIAGLEPDWSGLCLDADCFDPNAGLSDELIRGAMPQVKAISLFDEAGVTAQPLGKGAIAFDRLFGALARANFTGPITIHREYKTPDEPGALHRDLEFVRKQIDAAYHAPTS